MPRGSDSADLNEIRRYQSGYSRGKRIKHSNIYISYMKYIYSLKYKIFYVVNIFIFYNLNYVFVII